MLSNFAYFRNFEASSLIACSCSASARVSLPAFSWVISLRFHSDKTFPLHYCYYHFNNFLFIRTLLTPHSMAIYLIQSTNDETNGETIECVYLVISIPK